jgi:rhodanese-related sulfurtransferase
MKKIIILLGVLLSIYACQSSNGQTVLTPSQYQTAINKSDKVIIIDVRTPDEYKEGHLKNAINVDYYNNQFSVIMSTYPKDANIYLYCRSGNRSGKAASILKDLGYTNVFDMAGGFTAWTEQNLPYVK